MEMITLVLAAIKFNGKISFEMNVAGVSHNILPMNTNFHSPSVCLNLTPLLSVKGGLSHRYIQTFELWFMSQATS